MKVVSAPFHDTVMGRFEQLIGTTFRRRNSMQRARGLLILSLLAACAKPAPAPEASADTAQTASVQDQRLIAAARIALPPAEFVADSLPDRQSRGAQLVVAYCSQCHAVPSPAMHAAQDWPGIARRMWVRIDMMHGELGVAVPGDGDRTQLLAYLNANALRVAEHLPPGPGSATFVSLCSRCHLLPDPRIHSPTDWSTVILRMERNMERMRVSGLTNEQATAIVGYLQVASRR
jgi:cytochrome c5